MERQIGESDWKVFRELRVTALERFCQSVLAEACQLATATGQTSHQRYLAVFKLLQRRDEELADTFDAPRRSTALVQLARIRFQKLLDEDEFARFSSETRAAVQGFLDIWGPNHPIQADVKGRATLAFSECRVLLHTAHCERSQEEDSERAK
jgi:hypothetical protein